MSNWEDFKGLPDIINITDSKTLNKWAGAAIGVMADASGAIGLIQFGAGLIQLLQKGDVELRDLLSSMQANFAQLNSLISAQAKLERMGRVDQEINKAVAVFDQLLAFVSNPSLTDDFKLEQIGKCVEAVTFLSDNDDVWLSVYEETPYYDDAWSGKIAPPPPQVPLVFNYTYTLPQFVRAIYILVTTIGALKPTSLHQYDQVLNRAANRLQQVHDKIVNEGITGTKPPPNPGLSGPSEALSLTRRTLGPSRLIRPHPLVRCGGRRGQPRMCCGPMVRWSASREPTTFSHTSRSSDTE